MNPNCIERRDSTVAPQALHLMNNGMVEQLAEHFAERVRREAGTDPAQQVERVYLIALSRPPTRRGEATRPRGAERVRRRVGEATGGGREARPRRSRAEGADDLLSRDHELGELPVCGLRGRRCRSVTVGFTRRELLPAACPAASTARRWRHLLGAGSAGSRGRRSPPTDLKPRPAALPAEGQVRHPSVHERRPEPDGPVRSQADARQAPRQAVLRQDRRRGREFIKDAGALDAQPVQVRPARPVRACGSPTRMPHLARLVDDIAFIRSMYTTNLTHEPAVYLIQSGQDGAGPADARARGWSTAWAARTRTCRPTSCSTIRWACRSTASRTGRRASCRRSSRARGSARPARRC